MSFEQKANTVVEKARGLAPKVSSWADFSNAIFDQETGVVAQTFDDQMELQTFFDSSQYEEVNQMLLALMRKIGVQNGASPTAKSGKFLVRLPKTLHEVLEVE